ncbi:MAG: Rpn family recombination-promoting nuclease/putative transposase, partial [Nitrospirae bacterium]|nr:Rpn family recombination-promoting nuclease/putative transposase [Magnetococcales bacterium]
MADIAQPHDRFVRALLSDPERAGALLRERLPKEIAELLSPEPLRLVDGSFVDEALRHHLTDRLFQAKTMTGRTVLLYVLIEHKSFPDRRVGWQVVKYTVEWWKQWERENPDWE